MTDTGPRPDGDPIAPPDPDDTPVPPAWRGGLDAALYQELRRLARGRLRHERDDHTLSATALTHEAWMRLSTQEAGAWNDRGHFMALAATMMRRILVDHALAKQAGKRAGAHVTLGAVDREAAVPDPGVDVLDLHRALTAFAALDERAARVVELRYFGGLELDEIGEALGISLATVKRDWTVARAWLKSRLEGGADPR